MRDIKFRAWDKITKKMCVVWDIGFKGWDSPDETINYVNIEIENEGTVKRLPNEVEVSEFTGLNDKNGNDIYEGDIVNCQYMLGKVKTKEVIFFKGAFCATHIKNPAIGVLLGSHQEIEIIGNIHENPELLKE